MDIECICPPKPSGERRHDHDTITLRERLDFRGAMTARNAIVISKTEDPDASVAEIMATLTELYLLLGVQSWTLVDEKNKPIEVSKAAIREHLFPHHEIAMAVGNEADELYSEAVMLPLLVRASTSSPPTPSNGSTSPTTGSGHKSPTRSKRSSTSTSRTAGIGTISRLPVGGSRSSQNSATETRSAG